MYLSYVLVIVLFFVIFVCLACISKLMHWQWQQSKWIITQYKQRESLMYIRLMTKEGKLELVPEADETLSHGEKEYHSPFPDEVLTNEVEKEIENNQRSIF